MASDIGKFEAILFPSDGEREHPHIREYFDLPRKAQDARPP